MFTTVGVKIDLDTFVSVCKKLFNTFDSELNKYTTEWLKDNKGENKHYAIIDFLEDKANHYFSTINVEKQITIFEWCENDHKGDKKEDNNKTIVFGISILTCDNEAMKSISFNEVNACIEDMKVLIKHFDIDESKIELIVDAI
jgi:hypothetical protein